MMRSEPENLQARKFKLNVGAQPLFSICTLVTDHTLYNQMVESFRRGGFDGSDVEFLFVDNSQGNVFEAYAGLNELTAAARGKYAILCHQDVLINDDRSILEACLRELDQRDPSWALAGNAGVDRHRQSANCYRDHTGAEHRSSNLPHQVVSLDENFLLLKRSTQVGFSRDLSGFHLYGLDVCLQAEIRGWSAYVIEFCLCHESIGTIDASFLECRSNLEAKYQRFLRERTVKTTCTSVLLMSARKRRYRRRLNDLRWYRRAAWKWVRGKPIPPKQ